MYVRNFLCTWSGTVVSQFRLLSYSTATSGLRWELKPYAKLCLDSWLGHLVLGFGISDSNPFRHTTRRRPIVSIYLMFYPLNYSGTRSEVRFELTSSSLFKFSGESCRRLSLRGCSPFDTLHSIGSFPIFVAALSELSGHAAS